MKSRRALWPILLLLAACGGDGSDDVDGGRDGGLPGQRDAGADRAGNDAAPADGPAGFAEGPDAAAPSSPDGQAAEEAGADTPLPPPGPEAGMPDGSPISTSRRPPVFQPVRFLPSLPLHGNGWLAANAIAVGDLTGDGRNDVAVAQTRGVYAGDPGPRVSLFVQGSDGNLLAPSTTALPLDQFADPTALAIVDLGADGHQDLVLAHEFGGLLSFTQTAGGLGPPVALPITPTETSGKPFRLAVGHFNGDKLLDVIAGTKSSSADPKTYRDVQVYTQQTGGLVASAPLVVGAMWNQGITVGDFDGNGLDDVAVATDSFDDGRLGVRLQTTPGVWGEPKSHFLAVETFSPITLMAGDVTDDGRDDLVAAYGYRAGWVAVFRQAADGSALGPPELTPIDERPQAACLVDLDKDGRKDVVVLHNMQVGVLMQRPGGGFDPEELYRARASVQNTDLPMACGDVNGDGRVDVVLTHEKGLEVLLNAVDGPASAPCGGPGQACCSGKRCDAGARCNPDELCTPCGHAGELCCGGACTEAGTRCLGADAGARCVPCPANQYCGSTTCGARGERCCPGAVSCNDAATTCDRAGGGDGICRSCGGPGQACCPGAACTNGGCCHRGVCVPSGSSCGRGPDHAGLCQAGACAGCGQEGQPCCAGQSVGSFRPFVLSCKTAALACDSYGNVPHCSLCGGPGQRCCLGSLCGNGGCCVDGECIGSGAACPEGAGQCSQGSCGACGARDQPCCSSRCTGPGAICRYLTGGNRCEACGEKGQPCCDSGCRYPLLCGSSGCE
jgi:hypothetical protein